MSTQAPRPTLAQFLGNSPSPAEVADFLSNQSTNSTLADYLFRVWNRELEGKMSDEECIEQIHAVIQARLFQTPTHPNDMKEAPVAVAVLRDIFLSDGRFNYYRGDQEVEAEDETHLSAGVMSAGVVLLSHHGAFTPGVKRILRIFFANYNGVSEEAQRVVQALLGGPEG